MVGSFRRCRTLGGRSLCWLLALVHLAQLPTYIDCDGSDSHITHMESSHSPFQDLFRSFVVRSSNQQNHSMAGVHDSLVMTIQTWQPIPRPSFQVFDEWVDEEEVLGEAPGTSFSAIYALNPNLDPVDPLLNKALQSNLIQLRKYGPIPVRVSAQAHLTNGDLAFRVLRHVTHGRVPIYDPKPPTVRNVLFVSSNLLFNGVALPRDTVTLHWSVDEDVLVRKVEINGRLPDAMFVDGQPISITRGSMRATPGRHFKIVSTVRSTDTYGICQHEAVVADYTGARVSVQDRRTGGRIHIGDTRYFRRLCLAHGPEAVPQACGFYAKYDVEGYQAILEERQRKEEQKLRQAARKDRPVVATNGKQVAATDHKHSTSSPAVAQHSQLTSQNAERKERSGSHGASNASKKANDEGASILNLDDSLWGFEEGMLDSLR